jgi:lysozyme family protein
MTDPLFVRAVYRLFDLEGVEYHNVEGDSGGPTKFGLSKLAYPDLDIASLTAEQAIEIYKRDYGDPVNFEQVRNIDIAFQLFESAVNFDPPGAPVRATLCAQVALSVLGVPVAVDGKMGPETLRAINSYADQVALLKLMNGMQLAFLLVGASGTHDLIKAIEARLSTLRLFLRGWLRRV